MNYRRLRDRMNEVEKKIDKLEGNKHIQLSLEEQEVDSSIVIGLRMLEKRLGELEKTKKSVVKDTVFAMNTIPGKVYKRYHSVTSSESLPLIRLIDEKRNTSSISTFAFHCCGVYFPHIWIEAMVLMIEVTDD